MSENTFPQRYAVWRTSPGDRAEDAANLFGYYLIQHSRAEAIQSVPPGASPETRRAVEEAVDTALHNLMDLLEGFWALPVGDGYSAELALHVNVLQKDQVVESVPISPCLLDLPIGYWSWREDFASEQHAENPKDA